MLPDRITRVAVSPNCRREVHRTMIKCQECTEEMSSKAVACPHCGHPSKKPGERNLFTRWLFRIGMVLCFLVVGNWLHKPFHAALEQLLPSQYHDPVDKFFHVVFAQTAKEREAPEKLDECRRQLESCRQGRQHGGRLGR